MIQKAQYIEFAACVFAAGWLLSTVGNFYSYWLRHADRYAAAKVLLSSEVCTDPELRIAIRHFDQCSDAQSVVSISPMHRAFFSVAEDVHICGNRRCELLYIDITERLTSVLVLLSLTLLLCLLKACQRQKVHSHEMEGMHWQLPRRMIEHKKDI